MDARGDGAFISRLVQSNEVLQREGVDDLKLQDKRWVPEGPVTKQIINQGHVGTKFTIEDQEQHGVWLSGDSSQLRVGHGKEELA